MVTLSLVAMSSREGLASGSGDFLNDATLLILYDCSAKWGKGHSRYLLPSASLSRGREHISIIDGVDVMVHLYLKTQNQTFQTTEVAVHYSI